MTLPEPGLFPRRLTLELTNECNYNCAMCPSRIDRSWARGLMEERLFRKLVDEAAGYPPVALVPFFRGESLLHPRLAELLKYAKIKGLEPIQLATNGSLLDEATARGLLEAGLDFLSFSLDSMRPEEYARIRPGGRLDRVVDNIQRFLDLRDRGGYGTEVQVSATRTALNRESLGELVEYWRPLADRVRVYYEHSADGRTGSLDCAEVPGDMPRRACHKVFTDLVVYYDGGVAACNHDWFRHPPLGDAREKSLAAIWTSPAYEDLRRQHLEPERLTDQTCQGCDHWKVNYLEKPFIGEVYESKAA
ncbi:MAG: radical SAM protein [Thermodesulfobacteriota bacterium]